MNRQILFEVLSAFEKFRSFNIESNVGFQPIGNSLVKSPFLFPVSTEEPISLLFTIDFLIEEVYLEALVGCKVID